MRADIKVLMVFAIVAATRAGAQSAADGPVLGARALQPTAAFKIWVPAGQVRLVAWDRDSILVRGHVPKSENFYFSGNFAGMKLGVEQNSPRGRAGQSDIVAYVPRRGKFNVKTVTASIDGAGVSGWFYSVSGPIHLSGSATSVEVESMNGSLDLDVTTPWLRARTGDGHLLLRGAPEDVDASTIGGTLDVAATTVLRGQFGSVSGDIHYVGSPAPGAIFEFSNHSGAVDLLLPQNVSGVFALSSIVGPIENGFTAVRPIASATHSMRLSLGRGGSQVTVRTFKGTIRLRPQ
jgi:hypothetical protein